MKKSAVFKRENETIRFRFQKYHGLNPGDVHIIGHSLGAHTAGYAGALVEVK